MSTVTKTSTVVAGDNYNAGDLVSLAVGAAGSGAVGRIVTSGISAAGSSHFVTLASGDTRIKIDFEQIEMPRTIVVGASKKPTSKDAILIGHDNELPIPDESIVLCTPKASFQIEIAPNIFLRAQGKLPSKWHRFWQKLFLGVKYTEFAQHKETLEALELLKNNPI